LREEVFDQDGSDIDIDFEGCGDVKRGGWQENLLWGEVKKKQPLDSAAPR
jgi:hypothetical protein